MTILPGQKAKVYLDKRRVAFGEVLGINTKNKVILVNRPEFQALRTSEFDLFRERTEVEFVSPIGQLFIQWEATAIQTMNE